MSLISLRGGGGETTARFSTTTTTSPEASSSSQSPASLNRLNHIAIAVPNVEAAAATFRQLLPGAHVSTPQSLPKHGVRVAFVHLANTKLELLEPLGDASPVANFLKKNPAGGMHHLCLEVPDISAALHHVHTHTTVRPLSLEPKIGAHGTPVAFLHPKDVCGVLTELEEVK